MTVMHNALKVIKIKIHTIRTVGDRRSVVDVICAHIFAIQYVG